MSNNRQLLWTGPSGLSIPDNNTSPQALVPLANGLTQVQKNQIAAAFDLGAFDMGTEYIWRRTMKKLRGTLKGLGMKFIGEMLGNEEIDEYSNIETAITDFDTISLAENLGVISSTGALKLKHSLEVLGHFLDKESEQDEESFSIFESQQIVHGCIKYVLGAPNIDVSIEFSSFRDKLLSTNVPSNDPQVEMLVDSPNFYVRTIVSILLAAIKNEQGARQERALANLNTLFVRIWPILSEKEKWNVGSAYRDAIAKGDSSAAQGLKTALSKVKGFDYVPENLRSNTFIKAARAIIDTHVSMNNFYNEPPVVSALASLGTTIPTPALVDCIQAYLCVYLGNSYGYSWAAAGTAESELRLISPDRWNYYFSKAIDDDELVLGKLTSDRPIQRFNGLANEILHVVDREKLPKDHRALVDAAVKSDATRVKQIALKMLSDLRKGSS